MTNKREDFTYNQQIVRLINCHSNHILKNNELELIPLQKGYTFIFLTEAGFPFCWTDQMYQKFKNEEKIIEFLNGYSQVEFQKVFNEKKEKYFNAEKPISLDKKRQRNSPSLIPNLIIEFAPFIEDHVGIFKLPLKNDYRNSSTTSFNAIKSKISELYRVNINKGIQSFENMELNDSIKKQINNFITSKNKYEKNHGKIKHGNKPKTNVSTVSDVISLYGQEIDKNNERVQRTLREMMDPKSKFHITKGIYIIAGCRNIEFYNQPKISNRGVRRPPYGIGPHYTKSLSELKKFNSKTPSFMNEIKTSSLKKKKTGY